MARAFGKKRIEKFKKDLLKLILSYGAYEGGQYDYIIPTKAGDLHVRIEREPHSCWFIPMKFQNPEKAVEVLKGTGHMLNLNKFSGKYNVMQSKEADALELAEWHIKAVAVKKAMTFDKVDSLKDIEIGEVVQMTSLDFGGVKNRVVKIADDYTGLGRDIAYFGFFDRMRSGVPTPEEYAESLQNNKSVPHAFAIWGHSLESGMGTILEKYVNKF